MSPRQSYHTTVIYDDRRDLSKLECFRESNVYQLNSFSTFNQLHVIKRNMYIHVYHFHAYSRFREKDNLHFPSSASIRVAYRIALT